MCAVYITLSVQFSTRYTCIIGYSGTFMCRSRTQGSTSMLNAAPTERPRAKRQPATLPHAACVAMHAMARSDVHTIAMCPPRVRHGRVWREAACFREQCRGTCASISPSTCALVRRVSPPSRSQSDGGKIAAKGQPEHDQLDCSEDRAAIVEEGCDCRGALRL